MKIRKSTNRGKTEWFIDYRINGRRYRKSHRTRELAETAMQEIQEQIRDTGTVWLSLGDHERTEILQVLAEVKKAGLTLREIWARHQNGLIQGHVKERRTLEKAIEELITAKRTAKRRETYLSGLRQYLRHFARGREQITVDQITLTNVEEWFASRNETTSTRASNVFRISGLFSFCARRGYCTANPCDAIEPIRVEQRPPTIFTPHQVAKALIWAKRRGKPLLPWLVLSVLCGLRPEEADKTTGEHINLKTGTTTVDASASKVWQRRVVHLTTQAKAWLKTCTRLKTPFAVSRSTRRRYLRKLRDYLHLTEWPQDVLRHTFASYRMAEMQDAGKLAAEMGNSAGILMKHYRELMTKEKAHQYTRIMPA